MSRLGLRFVWAFYRLEQPTPPLPHVPVGGTGSYPLVGVVSLGSCLAFPFCLFPLLRPGARVEVRKQRVRSVGSALPAHSVLLSFSFFERLRQADKYCFSARCSAWDLRHRKARYSPCSTSRLEPCLILSATASDQPVGMHCFSLGRHGTAYSITSFPACAVLGRVLFRSPPIQTSNLVQSPPSEGPLLT